MVDDKNMTRGKTPEKAHMFDNSRNIKLVIYTLYGLCAIFFVADAFVHRHIDHAWEKLFGFHGVYGFVACVLLVIGAKELRKLIMRKEDYYDE